MLNVSNVVRRSSTYSGEKGVKAALEWRDGPFNAE